MEFWQSGKSSTIRDSDEVSGVRTCKTHYVLYMYYVRKNSILLAGTGVRIISSEACGFIPIKIHFSDYPKSLISRRNEVYVFINILSIITIFH